MSDLNFATTMAVCAVLGSIVGVILRSWNSVVAALMSCRKLLIATVHFDDESTKKVVVAYLVRNYKISSALDRVFGGRYTQFRDGGHGYVPFECFGDKPLLFWDGWRPIWLNVEVKTDEAKGNSVIYWGNKPKEPLPTSLSFFHGTVNIDELFRRSAELNNITTREARGDQTRRFFVKKVPDPQIKGSARSVAGTAPEWFRDGSYRLVCNRVEELGRTLSAEVGRATDNLYFPPHVGQLIQELASWRDSKEWYAARGIPWKRGWALYGPPGTGKTALVRAVAEDLDMPVFVYALGAMRNEDLELSWEDMRSHTPCIALFEDFDTVFHGRQNIYGQTTLADVMAEVTKPTANSSGVDATGKLTFDCLLNCLDGVEKSNGIFVVFTTNHVDKLDPALGQPVKNADGTMDFISTRPGRIDRAMELGYMTTDDKLRLAARIFFDDEDGLEMMRRRIASEGSLDTPAQFQEKCAQLALARRWKFGAQKNEEPSSTPSSPAFCRH